MNLMLLMPEWIVLGTLVVLTVFELFAGRDDVFYKRTRALLQLGGGLAVLTALLRVEPRIGTAFGGTFISDPFSTFFKFLFLIAAGAVIQMTREFFHGRREKAHEFNLVLWVILAGLFLLVSANDFLIFFLALETVTLGFYILNAYLKDDAASTEAGMKYFIIGSLSSAVLIFGISLIYVVSGSTFFSVVRSVYSADPTHPLMITGALMVLAGLFFKAGVFPFQLWIPDVYQGAPTPATAFLSVASKAAGFAGLLRLLHSVFLPLVSQSAILFGTLAVLTLLYGNLGALKQTQMKRLFGYSSIGHAGYLLIAMAAGREFGTSALLFYLAAYAITTLAIFLVISIAGRELQSDDIDTYRGLGRRAPFLAGIFFLALLSSAGVPPLAGFAGKFLVLFSAVQNGLTPLALIGALAVAVSLYYYLSIVRVMYFEQATVPGMLTVSTTSKAMLVLLAAAMLLLGFFQAPLWHAAEHAAKYLF